MLSSATTAKKQPNPSPHPMFGVRLVRLDNGRYQSEVWPIASPKDLEVGDVMPNKYEALGSIPMLILRKMRK